VDPFALLFRRGHWYLVGRDATKDEIRAYRLSRLAGPVRDVGAAQRPPAGFRAADHLQAGPWGLGEPEAVARVAFSPKVAPWVVPATTGARVIRTLADGWVEVEVPASRTEPFVSWVLSFGPDARVDAPRVVRDELIGRLEGVLGDG
jgi:proteasome accessory factor B